MKTYLSVILSLFLVCSLQATPKKKPTVFKSQDSEISYGPNSTKLKRDKFNYIELGGTSSGITFRNQDGFDNTQQNLQFRADLGLYSPDDIPLTLGGHFRVGTTSFLWKDLTPITSQSHIRLGTGDNDGIRNNNSSFTIESSGASMQFNDDAIHARVGSNFDVRVGNHIAARFQANGAEFFSAVSGDHIGAIRPSSFTIYDGAGHDNVLMTNKGMWFKSYNGNADDYQIGTYDPYGTYTSILEFDGAGTITGGVMLDWLNYLDSAIFDINLRLTAAGIAETTDKHQKYIAGIPLPTDYTPYGLFGVYMLGSMIRKRFFDKS